MAARFKLDENLPRDAQSLLVRAGHDTHTASEERLGGGPDQEVIDACRKEDRILVTLDLDFADIRRYPPSAHRGIWVLRPGTQTIENVLSLLNAALTILDKEPSVNRLWVIEAGRVRIRE